MLLACCRHVAAMSCRIQTVINGKQVAEDGVMLSNPLQTVVSTLKKGIPANSLVTFRYAALRQILSGYYISLNEKGTAQSRECVRQQPTPGSLSGVRSRTTFKLGRLHTSYCCTNKQAHVIAST
jgi:hypothetical protein